MKKWVISYYGIMTLSFILILEMIISLLLTLLISNATTNRCDKSLLFSRLVITSLILSSFLAYTNLYLRPYETGIGIYGGLFNVSTLTQTFNIFIFLASAIILTLTSFYPRKINVKCLSSIYNLFFKAMYYNKSIVSSKNGEQFRIIEYSLIIVFIISGAVFLISTADLISIFLAIELQSYGLYILCTLYRDSESATASGLTYFLLGGLSSCFILFGSALLYINSGTTNLDNIFIIASISEVKNYNLNVIMYMYEPYYINMSLIMMFTGFLFKVSAAPFHFWSPDVYDGIPTIVTTYVAIVAKISIFAFLLEVVYYTNYDFSAFNLNNILILSSLLSLFIGSVLGLTQSRIKRLFAYSTISHVGFILLALSINSMESIQSFIFYIFQYSLSNLNAFIILLTIGYSLYTYVSKDKNYNHAYDNSETISDNYSPVQLISQIKGYFYINPFISISLAITIFSFVGIPPLIGFFAKQMILSAALDRGYIFIALVGILTSVIGAGYYLNLIKHIFFYKNDFIVNPSIENINVVVHSDKTTLKSPGTENTRECIYVNTEKIIINGSYSSIISIITLLLVLFIYVPEEWFNIVGIISLTLFNS